MLKKKVISKYFRYASTLAVLIVTWWIATITNLVNPLFLPKLDSVCKSLVNMLSGQDIYIDAIATTYRALLGIIFSIMMAVPLGLIFGRFPMVYQFFELPTDFFRSIPSSALFFLFILIFGIGDAAKVAVVFYGCSLVLLVNTIYGAKATREKQDHINMLRSFGATPWQVFHLTILYDALPHISAGIRVCISLSLVLVIITEMFLSATSGLGRKIYDCYLAYRIPDMYAAIILLGLIGFGANKACLFLEHKISFWLPNQG